MRHSRRVHFFRRTLYRDDSWQAFLLGGYRFLHFSEDLRIGENLTSLNPNSLGTAIVVGDHFATKNTFHGGEVGIEADYRVGRFSLEFLGKLAVGNVHRQVQIDGSTEVTVRGAAPIVHPGGLLALSSNSGSFTSDKVEVVPQVGVTAGWQVTPRLRATVGYTVLWWPGVARPGDQIDLAVNPGLLPPPMPGGVARPSFALHDSSLTAQGLRFGLEIRY
jgi:hypothetical protein